MQMDPPIIAWRKPEASTMICNVSVSFSAHTTNVNICMCIQNEHGEFVFAKTKWFTPHCAIHVGMAIGLFQALDWVHQL